MVMPHNDNITHRVDLTPSRAIVLKIGWKSPRYHDLQGKYSYKLPAFNEWKERYDSGEIDIVAKEQLTPLQLSKTGLKGTIDVLIIGLDEANSAGRRHHDIPYRCVFDVSFDDQGQVAKGSVTAYGYSSGDLTTELRRPQPTSCTVLMHKLGSRPRALNLPRY